MKVTRIKNKNHKIELAHELSRHIVENMDSATLKQFAIDLASGEYMQIEDDDLIREYNAYMGEVS